uniref:Cytosolic endo-beta-N-acetylglucosaminidase-like n=1 Tax=Hirondellea gigas TaxID=1518452 RepID=A0A6A7FVT6_9CRUS
MKCEDEIHPLTTLVELLEWNEDTHVSSMCQAILDDIPSLPPLSPSDQPKTLVCHDMKGGYNEDRLLSGCSDHTAYRFVHWSAIDSFVYFSHHFITIPPPGWTAAAHANGVDMLGTLITENDEGVTLCSEIFSSLETVEKVVMQLTNITRIHKFQGWLINIENKVAPVAIGLVIVFLQKLRKAMKGLDQRNLLIWYDSITHDGSLHWQDQLNGYNSCFYEVCDAIFLNYSWKVEYLKASKSYATLFPNLQHFGVAISREAQGKNSTQANCSCDGGSTDHKTDASGGEEYMKECIKCNALTKLSTENWHVKSYELSKFNKIFSGEEKKIYVGVDVFGRNFYGGGGFNTKEAMEVIREQGLSAAIFAPGWCYETLGCEGFTENNCTFWGLLDEFLYQHGPRTLPLYTTFSEGSGDVIYCDGVAMEKKNWFNLARQSLLPNLTQKCGGGGSITLCQSDAYIGGSCLLLTNPSLEPLTVWLWSSCHLHSNTPLKVVVAHKVTCALDQKLDVPCQISIESDSEADNSLLIKFRIWRKEEEENWTKEDDIKVRTSSNYWRLRTTNFIPNKESAITRIGVKIPAAVHVKIGLLCIDKEETEH